MRHITITFWLDDCCRNNDISSLADLYTFSVDHVAYGQPRTHDLKPGGRHIKQGGLPRTHDLKPGGRHIAVTEHNKLEYTQ